MTRTTGLLLAVAVFFCGLIYMAMNQRATFSQPGQFRTTRLPKIPVIVSEKPQPMSQIITGLYANETAESRIVIHDIDGVASWTWSAEDAKAQNLSAELRRCVEGGRSSPDSKWANNGASVISIFNYAAVIINHLPGDPLDKKITFGVCVDQYNMDNSHTLEVVPDGKLAIATTSNDYEANIKLFNISSGLQYDGGPVQEFGFISAVHSLLWDNHDKLLWAAGSHNPPNQALESRSAINAYKYTDGSFQEDPIYSYNFSDPQTLKTEWVGTDDETWWAGGHDVSGLPNQRTLLLSTDIDIYALNIGSETFENGSAVVDKYLPGFKPVGDRIGLNGEALPRSDLKSISFDGNNNVLYVQGDWRHWPGTQINCIKNGTLRPPLKYLNQLYRSRWFADTPGWPKAQFQSSG